MNFKRYLKEYIDASSNKEYDMMLSGWMPITPSLMDKFKIRYEPIYRVAGLNSPKTEKKYENKKKVFSGFTKGSQGISSGAISGGVYLYEKSGDVLIELPRDAGTSLDRNGHKWLNLYTLDLSTKFKGKIFDKMNKYAKKFTNSNIDYFIKNEATQKQKRDFIKWYYDESKKLLTDNFIKNLIKEYIDSIKGVNTIWNNNELLYTNYKLNGAYIITNKPLDIFKTQLKEDDWAFSYFKERLENLQKNNIKYLGCIYHSQIKDIHSEFKPANTFSEYIDIDKIETEF